MIKSCTHECRHSSAQSDKTALPLIPRLEYQLRQWDRITQSMLYMYALQTHTYKGNKGLCIYVDSRHKR